MTASWVEKFKQFRYIAYTIILLVNFQETISRFGLPMAMVGGMTKENCTDVLDNGTYCWSEREKAQVLGSFFYTYCLQIPVTMLARKVGFSLMLKVYMLMSALVIGGVPWFAMWSPYAVIAAQAARGLVASMFMSYNYEFVRVWTVPSESLYFIGGFGGMMLLGNHVGGFVSGLIARHLGWENYFYICGVNFLILLLLILIFVTATPGDSKLMNQQEKKLYLNKYTSEDSDAKKAPYFEIFKRSYLWAFCVFLFTIEIVYITILINIPFYLKEVLMMRTEDISLILLTFGVVLVAGTFGATRFVATIDSIKHLSWLQKRQITAFGPFLIQTLLIILIPNIDSEPVAVTLLVIMAFCNCNMFVGSIFSISYEIDPINSSTVVSIVNGCGQLAGFVAPALREYITTTDKMDPNYDEVYRQRWKQYFYVLAGFPIVGMSCMLLSQIIRKKEWVNMFEEGERCKNTVMENQYAVEKEVDESTQRPD